MGLSEQALAGAVGISVCQLQQTLTQRGLWGFAPRGCLQPVPAGTANGVTDIATGIVGALEEGLVGLDECLEHIQGCGGILRRQFPGDLIQP
ncbi:hypothetical protein PO768_10000 [Paucibacter sp. XJ19-41]|nr:hypothetical protein [Paucibacter sp. XJ19-41]